MWMIIGIFFLMLLIGVPVAFGVGISSMLYLALNGKDLVILTQRIFAGGDSFTLMAIPLFIFAGEIMNACGLSAGLARAFRPILRRLMPQASRDEKTLAALSANVSANLLGLGNAATPLGIQAARRMARGCSGTASDELCLLVVLNTASIQLLPATIASVRSASGAQSPFDILPAVWLASALSVVVGVLTAKFLAAVGRCRR